MSEDLSLLVAFFFKWCLTGCPDGVATLKVRKGAFDALKKGSGALGKVE